MQKKFGLRHIFRKLREGEESGGELWRDGGEKWPVPDPRVRGCRQTREPQNKKVACATITKKKRMQNLRKGQSKQKSCQRVWSGEGGHFDIDASGIQDKYSRP